MLMANTTIRRSKKESKTYDDSFLHIKKDSSHRMREVFVNVVKFSVESEWHR